MAIIFDTRLAAAKILADEGIEIVDCFSTEAKKRKPIHVCILNLLPEKPEAETQWLRGLSFSEFDIEVTFFMVESYRPTHTSQEYLHSFYSTPTQMWEKNFDGMIITGADVEKFPFEEIRYWPELVHIFDWADTHVKSCYFSCWGSMAAMYHYHGIGKELLAGKLSGIYSHWEPHPEHVLMTGITEPVYIPHSRISRSLPDAIHACPALTILAEAEKPGPTVCCDDVRKHVFTVGHWEYEPWVLQNQYKRDVSKGYAMKAPENYFDENGNIRMDNDWRSQFHTMMANWLRYYVVENRS